MSKSKKRKGSHHKPKGTDKKVSANFVFFSVLLLIALMIGKWSYDMSVEHDLSVVGAGTNVVVQVHDPN
ncbi:MAG: hypothetical protein GY786_07065 [Proteobacteria bacterium]|nr:hypothetical protein [Pseudomonadota bacterium]